MAVADEELRAVEDVAVPAYPERSRRVPLRREADTGRVEAGRGLGEGERPDLAPGDEGAADLLDEDDEVEVAHADAAVGLGYDEAHPALLRHLRPQLLRVASVVLLHVAHVRLRALLLQEVARELAQHLLLFTQAEVHPLSPF